MRQTKLLHLLLTAFVLLAYQSNALHFEHVFEKKDDCHICLSDEQTDNVLYETSHALETHLTESIVENSYVHQKISRPDVRKIVQKPIRKTVDLAGLHSFYTAFIPLGYFSHAPPSSLS
ncbi:MAG TPA: hypothetical protein VLL31_00085 [Sulfurovum sp.]|nr:hypothetical protein [Sulfurovum sp.]